MHSSLASRLVVRLLLLFVLVSVVSIVILTKCGFEELTAQEALHHHPSEANGPSYVLGGDQEAEIERLKHEVLTLRAQIVILQNNRSGHSGVASNGSSLHLPETTVGTALPPLSHHYDCSSYIRKQVGAAEILHGLPLNNEYELIPFNHFTFTRVFPIDLGLGKRVVEKPIGYRRRDLIGAVNKALESLNRNHSARVRAKAAGVPVAVAGVGTIAGGGGAAQDVIKYTLDDFIEGIYRTEPTTGTQYELYFQSVKHQTSPVRRALVMRPFAPLQTVQLSETPASRSPSSNPAVIHVIVPLAGRLHSFRSFLQMFASLADRHLELIVVYFGESGLAQARRMAELSERTQFLALNETFSRAKALRLGAEHIVSPSPSEDVLLFMCDVDIMFTARFLERCRWNAAPGKKVYYPVVFSLYNPHVVYTLQGKPLPSDEEQLVISKDTGFWRDFGYGMTCQYRSNFLQIRGFDEEEIVGWGGEDVMLYRKYIRSKIKIIRATDPGIFHRWHTKVCASSLTADQYRACIRSRALNEASHAQLGFLAFRDDIAAANAAKLHS
ncbi:chondroitin sulfate N-acetylgalactosaminyltransferase 1 [Drosophila obscura]|uniref:chondroitin sulfate N-acetylgalactosaminyltransferase 1 n=1 Tax=Drosophila obscura TaxID=7282 RepID=UPI001BB1C52B|nr:chondroitin sulfate N-acetylgalactosaminyltransferase 1 [Drosophila obscura]XP_022230444.2 chondroitin sulfate N-acetylgalactosaminyltransferase 1 [Drosophila obscura]